MNITMAAAHLACPELAVDKFYGSNPDQDVDSFVKIFNHFLQKLKTILLRVLFWNFPIISMAT